MVVAMDVIAVHSPAPTGRVFSIFCRSAPTGARMDAVVIAMSLIAVRSLDSAERLY